MYTTLTEVLSWISSTTFGSNLKPIASAAPVRMSTNTELTKQQKAKRERGRESVRLREILF